jgi:hypothetical protein
MTPDEKFWWELGVQVVVAIGTVGSVIVALFGEWLRRRLNQPKVEIRLATPFEENFKHTLSSIKNDAYGKQSVHESDLRDFRDYLGEVIKGESSPVLQEVVVYLIQADVKNEAGSYFVDWRGELPIKWREEGIAFTMGGPGRFAFSRMRRPVGRPTQFPMIEVVNGKWVEVPVLATPAGDDEHFRWRDKKITTTLYFQARALETVSDVLRIEVAWDGKWPEHINDLGKHLQVTAKQ